MNHLRIIYELKYYLQIEELFADQRIIRGSTMEQQLERKYLRH